MRDLNAKLLYFIFAFCQYLTVPVSFTMGFILRPQIVWPASGLSVFPGTLVIANHQSRMDPFYVTYHLRPKNWVRNLPVRYPVASEYMEKPIVGSAVWLMGGYNIGKTFMDKAKKLIYTRDMLLSNRTVLLFPEGRIVREGKMVTDFQNGIYALINDSTPILLARLVNMNSWSWFSLSRHQVKIVFSEIIKDMPMEEKFKKIGKFYSADVSDTHDF